MQNAALKISESRFPVGSRPVRNTLHLFRDNAKDQAQKANAFARLLAKEEHCIDRATD